MQKVTKLLLVLLMLPLAFASAASYKKVSEKRMSAYLMVFHRDDTHSLYMALLDPHRGEHNWDGG